MPQDYKKTVEDLQQYLTDEVISEILASPHFMTANQIIISYLLKTYGHHLSSFLSMLESIKDAPALTALINQLKESEFMYETVSIVGAKLYNILLLLLSFTASSTEGLTVFECHLLLYFVAYSLMIYAERQLAGIEKPDPTSSIGPTYHQNNDPMVFTILEMNKVKPECKYFCLLQISHKYITLSVVYLQ